MASTASSSGTYTLNRAPPQQQSSSYFSSFPTLSGIRQSAWTAIDILTLFARSLIDPNVKSVSDGSNRSDTGVRRVATVHAQAVRGSTSGGMSGSGNRLGGGGGSGSNGSSGGGGGGARIGRVSGLSGPTNCTSGA